MKKVTKTTSNKNFTQAVVILSNKTSPKKANSMTIATLIKLLVIRIVANNFLGDCNRDLIVLVCCGCVCEALSISDFDNENKATSAPDIMAERMRSTQNPMTPVIKAVFKLKNKSNKLWGSGSKFKQIN